MRIGKKGTIDMHTTSSAPRRGVLGLIAICLALTALGASAVPASALAPRSYDSQISGFKAGTLTGIAFDGSENIWLSYGEPGGNFEEPANGYVFQLNPYPSGTILSEFTSDKFHRAGCSPSATNESIGINKSTGNIYVADSGCGGIIEFNSAGTRIGELPLYNAKPELGGGPNIAVDNSGGPTNGRVYAAMDFGDESVGYNSYILALGPTLSTTRFGGEKPYIKGSRIIGTPSGNFGGQSLVGAATDANGNLYVFDRSRQVVDEFNSSGEFIQEITAAGVPNGLQCFSRCGISIDPTNQNILVTDSTFGPPGTSSIVEFSQTGSYIREIKGTEAPAGNIGHPTYTAVDPNGFLYVVDTENEVVDIFNPAVIPPKIVNEQPSSPTETSATLNATVDPNTAGNIVACHFEYGTSLGNYNLGSKPCTPDPASAPPGSNFTVPTQVHTEISGLTPETPYHYRVVAENELGTVAKGADQIYTPHYVHGLRTDPVSAVTGTSATLNGSFVGNGDDTHYYFEWGPTIAYDHRTAAPPGTDAGSPSGPGRTTVAFNLTGLDPRARYHYRIVADNSSGIGHGEDVVFTTGKSAPLVKEGAIDIRSAGATLSALLNAGGEATTYHFEWGTEDCVANPGACTVLPTQEAGSEAGYRRVSAPISGLSPETTYHFAIRAHNALGDSGYDTTFTTFPETEPIESCPENALARQQTGAALLLDCRAYELVSAANSGGYDVESDLVPGQKPYGGYPHASGAQGPSRVLYGVHDGAIPGVAGSPTNKEVDPYIATRGSEGWSTTYVGIPANDPFASGPFSSVPTGAGAGLETFAFGGEGSCSPCFEGGYTGIPLHLPNGQLVQGMVSSGVTAPGPSSKPDGYVAKNLSADGHHLVFGSTSQFAVGGNDGTGDVSIYDRNLTTGQTKVVSNAPGGGPLTCLQGAGNCHSPGDRNGIGELDISGDGSRIVVGQKVSTDAEGNVYWHLYMDIDDGAESVDLTPGASQGVLYDGMTEDGSRVFFTTKSALAATPADGDASADIYEAAVSSAGAVTLSRVSSGVSGAGDSDSCDPSENGARPHWNTVGLAENCDAVALGGGAGVASASGALYFLSPEQLETGQGTLDEPNLYVAEPGSAPKFVATLAPDDPVVVDALSAAEARKPADFQVNPDGDFAAFPTTRQLVGDFENGDFTEVYRYSSTGGLDCVSCNPTNAQAEGSATLASNGLSLTDDGRVFFNSPDPLVIRDADKRQDVYEWEKGTVQLISSGSSVFGSSLLGASADGTDAFFFTHDTLAGQDLNGPLTKLYDARAGGGFFVVPAPPPCAASDECHGPSSQAPGPPSIRTVTGKPSTGGACRKPRVKKHGKCVKKHRRKPHRGHRSKPHRGHRNG